MSERPLNVYRLGVINVVFSDALKMITSRGYRELA